FAHAAQRRADSQRIRMLFTFDRPALVATVSAALLAVAFPAHAEEEDEAVLSFDEVAEVPLDAPRRLPEVTPSAQALLEGVGRIEVLLGGATWDKTNDAYLSPLEGGALAELTLDGRLQRSLE